MATCGNFDYSTATIDQPKQFAPSYQTVKYSAISHGSSQSKEMPTDEHDKTKWKSEALGQNMRSLITTLLTDRGSAFFVDFPANSYPFGVNTTGGDTLCRTATKKYTIKQVNGYIYSIGLEVQKV